MQSLTNICRICLIENTPLININNVCEGGDIKWITTLECILPEIDFNELNLSDSLCEACCNKLQFIYEFKQQCIRNNRLLQLHKNTTVIKIECEDESIEDIMETNSCTEEDLLGFRVVNNEHVPVYHSPIKQEEHFDTKLELKSRINVEDYKLKTVQVMLCDVRHDLQNILKTTKISRKSLNLLRNYTIPKWLKEIPPEEINKSNRSREMLIFGVYDCDHCGYRCSSRREFKRHQNVHNDTLPYKCNECNRSYNSRQALTMHQRTHIARLYKCKKCDHIYTSFVALNAHQRVHSRIKPYKCSECDRRYKSNDALMVHRRVHTGEMPYTCSMCNLQFMNLYNVNYHMLRFHGMSSHKCNVCGAAFVNKHNLDCHLERHKDSLPFQCPMCYYRFRTKKFLKTHILIHLT